MLLFAATAGLGIVSFLIVILYYGALHDIWHEIGRPDIWHGQGPAAFELKLWHPDGYPLNCPMEGVCNDAQGLDSRSYHHRDS